MTDPDPAREDPAAAPPPSEDADGSTDDGANDGTDDGTDDGANDGALRPALWVTGLIVLVLLLLAVFGLD
ncbi:MAG: hypothetical protein R3322_05240 [Kiloniellales bacterium]|nr:hypothetical protein [Kiloniellales bacterium]